MKTVSQIYNEIGNTLKVNVKVDDWIEAFLKIEKHEGVVGYNGGYIANDEKFISFKLRDFPEETEDNIKELHKITTEGGHNRWNRAVFRMWPNNKFEMEFIWDQALDDEIERLSKE